MNIAAFLKQVADKYHNEIVKQKRKYSGLPYTVHTDEVAAIYASVFPDDLIGQAVAHGHDLFEDTPLTPKALDDILVIHYGFQPSVAKEVVTGIIHLTDEFVREKYPTLNRATRKEKERNRLALIPIREKNVKLCDLISNTADIVKNDPDFARVYLDEKAALLPLLTAADSTLFHRAFNQLNESKRVLGLTR